MPEGLDWDLWRPCRAEPPLCTLHELRTVYSLADLLEMHVLLDFGEDLEAAAQAKAKKIAKQNAVKER